LKDCFKRTRGPNYIIITKEEIKDMVYDDELLKFPFQLEPRNFRGTTTIEKKFAELIRKEEERQALQQMAKILKPPR